MKDWSPEQIEAELRRQRPAAPPADFIQKLIAAEPRPAEVRAPTTRALARQAPGWRDAWALLRWWLAPAMALAVVAFFVFKPHTTPVFLSPEAETASAEAPAKADDVQIESELVSSFDTVARLPSGMPVRYRCREWVDEVTLRDRSRGLVVEKRAPRVEVIPVRFETY